MKHCPANKWWMMKVTLFLLTTGIWASPVSKEVDDEDTLIATINSMDIEDSSSSSSGCFPSLLPTTNLKKCSSDDKSSFIATIFQNPTQISQGADGIVYKWTRPRDNKVMAVKKYLKKDDESKKEFLREMKLLSLFKGEGITADIDCAFKDFRGNLYYMMTFLPGTAIRADRFYNPAIHNFNVQWASMCLKMSKIVTKVHKKGIVHLDLHLRNWILSPEGRLYIIDFSRARKTGLFQSKSKCPAPESKEFPCCYSKQSDSWILGKMFLVLFENMVDILATYRGVNETKLQDKLLSLQDEVDSNRINFIVERMGFEDHQIRFSVEEGMELLANLKQKWEKIVNENKQQPQ